MRIYANILPVLLILSNPCLKECVDINPCRECNIYKETTTTKHLTFKQKNTMHNSYLHWQRPGPKPKTTPTNPHTQLDQLAPVDLQEKVFDFARTLKNVVIGPSLVSVPGARAFHLPADQHVKHGCAMVQGEFAHLHPASDGSLHMTLPSNIVEKVIELGWAERHPLAGKYGLPDNIVMVFGPRNEKELEAVIDLVHTSYTHANNCR
jgi:phospholipase/carboxylesterase